MKKVQYNKIADNKTNQSSINSNNGSNTLLSILLHRLELMGLFKSFMVRTSLRRCSSMVRSHFVLATFSILALAFMLSLFSILATTSNTHAASLTMSIDQAPVINLMPKTATGDFAKSSDSTISVTTGYSSGYTLGITASSSTDLVNSSDNTKVMSSISSATSENDFKASSNGDTYNNKWGYLPSKLNSTANTSFLPSPSTTEGDIIDVTDTANSVANTYTLAIGARANLDTPVGAYSNTFVISAVANVSFLTINYNANNSYTGSSAYFGSDTSSLVNTMDYDATSEQVAITNPQYSHTANISDDGTNSTNYDNNLNTNEVLSFPGADHLGISLTYQTEACCDFVVVWPGNCPNYRAGTTADVNLGTKYANSTRTTTNITINNSAVTFGFKSDGSVNKYGYYAVVTGYDSSNNVLTHGTAYTKTAETGTYSAPTIPSGMNFVGWATTNNATIAEYTSESDISTGLAKINGDDPVTLYPVYTSNVTIKTATGISSVYIREVGDSTNLCSTSSTSGTVCALTTGKAYNLYASVSFGYTFSSWTKSGVGTLSSTTTYDPVTFTPGAGATTLTPSTTPSSYTITVNFVGGVSSVTFANATYGTQTVSSSGGTVSLKFDQQYNITVTLNNGNYFLSWEKVSGLGTIGSTSTMNTYFRPSNGTATLRITAANTRIKTADGIDSVTVSTTGGSQVCTTTDATTGAYCNLTLGTTYNITATVHQGYTFSSWSNTGNGTIGSSTSSTITFTPAQSSAIDVITPSATGNPYTVTIVFGNEHVSSVTVDGETFTTSGGTKTLTAGTAYTISGTTDLNTVSFTASANGVVAGSTFTLYGDATLTAEGLDRVYIQDLTLANCPADGMTVYDKRDENDYTVKLINGQCWMTQNLRYLGDTGSATVTMTIGGNNSNVANTSITLYSLNSSNTGGFGAYSSHCDNIYGYKYACVYDSGSTSTGVWYNYYAASAGTIGSTSNSTAATSDICPAGWHLPSGPNTTANTDFNKLVGNTTYAWQDATAGLTAFSAVAGGNYGDGSLGSTGYGHWWSATAGDTLNRHNLRYDSSNGQFNGRNNSGRTYGFFVRCVRSS